MTTQHTTVRAATRSAVPSTILASGRLTAWRGVDLITAAMLAVAFGVVFWGFDTFVYPLVSAMTVGFPPASELALGVWLIPAVVGGLLIRRPGAALFTELVAANIELLPRLRCRVRRCDCGPRRPGARAGSRPLRCPQCLPGRPGSP
ncbi:ECF transporter S component [Cryobacterium tagatosivorans]|uniref:ECF transporter S component n=1 Tax=Cryobacterium tagatosivorans TaxID=1259199 RepID=UPI001F53F6CC|nr:ECF transporter S component [Cryobacterium tagatosivorans]